MIFQVHEFKTDKCRPLGNQPGQSNKEERMRIQLDKLTKPRTRQTGGMTVFTAILVLIVLTLMMFYAARVGLFEQRVSANEVRQKTAFHAAESAVDQGIEYLLSNSALILSAGVDEFPDGIGGLTRDGWFDPAAPRWALCTQALTEDEESPCGGATAMKVGSYYYDDPATDLATVPVDSMPLGTLEFVDGVTARLSANICFIDPAAPGGSCIDPPADQEEEAVSYMIITMLGYGYSDCTDTTDVATCGGEATVAKPVANFKNLAGSPTVPLVTKSTFPPGGTAEVVPNPNAGGVGVPVSVWGNTNPACPADPPILGEGGNWSTCQLHEWYGADAAPKNVRCATAACNCSREEAISYSATPTVHQGMDIKLDDSFPCDLFEVFFGVPRSMYQTIKSSATVLSDCSSLGPESSGLYWISGAECAISANTTVGSPRTPIILVSAASETILQGGAEIFGVLYIFDGEDANATIYNRGDNAVYGAAVVDATMGTYNGTFQVVYSSGVLASASGNNGLGSVGGGWRDFGLPELPW